LLHAIVHSAGIQDRDGGIMLLATLFGQFPFLEKLFADSAYQGPIFGSALAKTLPGLETEIVKRSDHAKGFVQLALAQDMLVFAQTQDKRDILALQIWHL
jgi:putative transposase